VNNRKVTLTGEDHQVIFAETEYVRHRNLCLKNVILERCDMKLSVVKTKTVVFKTKELERCKDYYNQ